jgi:hypothetical protein
LFAWRADWLPDDQFRHAPAGVGDDSDQRPAYRQKPCHRGDGSRLAVANRQAKLKAPSRYLCRASKGRFPQLLLVEHLAEDPHLDLLRSGQIVVAPAKQTKSVYSKISFTNDVDI